MSSSPIQFTAASLAVISPWWIPTVDHVSQVAATWLPILGCLWMIIQIFGYFVKKRDK